MLVKVSKKYFGKFGVYNELTNSIEMKDQKSAPFELNDALASFHLKNGVLVAADDTEEEQIPAPIKEETVAEVPVSEPEEGIEEEIGDSIPEELPEMPEESQQSGTDDLDSITDYKVLKEMAKEAGINPFGKTKDELREAIRKTR